MWISKEKYDALIQRINTMEEILLHVEQASNIVILYEEAYRDETSQNPLEFVPRHTIGFSKRNAESIISVSDAIEIIMKKLGIELVKKRKIESEVMLKDINIKKDGD